MVINNGEYDNYNFQGKLIINIADSLFQLEEDLAQAYEEKPSKYLKSLSSLRIFLDKIIGMDLKCSPKDIEYVEKCLKLAELNYNNNSLLEGAEYLSLSYQKICNIIKANNMMFPKNRKVTSFKKWTEQQLM